MAKRQKGWNKLKLNLKALGRFLATRHRKALLKNHSFSIISNTCIGGVITHNVGEQFRSPTVNLIIFEDQFLIFCRHLREYSNCPVEKPTLDESEQFQHLNYPVGILRGGTVNLPDINLYFVHYKSFEEAREKWVERYKRVNYDDLFIIMDRGLDAKDEILDEFYQLPYEHKVFFTNKTDHVRWPDNFRFSFYSPEKYFSGCLYKNEWKRMEVHHWLDEFDYIRWLNEGIIAIKQDNQLSIMPAQSKDIF